MLQRIINKCKCSGKEKMRNKVAKKLKKIAHKWAYTKSILVNFVYPKGSARRFYQDLKTDYKNRTVELLSKGA